MQVVVPHVLISCRFVVLARRYAIATINLFHNKCETTSGIVNLRSHFQRQVEDILEVLIGNDKDVPLIVRPLMRTNECRYNSIAINPVTFNRENVFVFDAAQKQAKGTDVTARSMAEHKLIIIYRPQPSRA